MDKFSFVICDARSGSFHVQHVSREFEDLFGCNASECAGKKASEILSTSLSNTALHKVIAARGLTEEQANGAIQRMSKELEASSPAKSRSSLLVNVGSSGQLFSCEMAWSKKVHPVLGWSYYVGLQRDVSRDISPGELLEAACDNMLYDQICNKWNGVAASRGIAPLSEKMDSCSDKFDAAAEQAWKDEVTKGLHGKKSSRRADAETSSIWSRSTASTLSSRKDENLDKDKKVKAKSARQTHHFAALLLPQSESLESQEPSESQADASKFLGPTTSTQDTQDAQNAKKGSEEGLGLEEGFGSFEDPSQRKAQLEEFWSDAFESMSDCSWQDCPTPTLTSTAPRFDPDPCASEVTDPVQHIQQVAKNGIENLKIPFVVAAPTVEGCPIALRSAGFEQLTISEDVKNGSDLRQVLEPSNIRALKEWKLFCETASSGDLWETEGVAVLEDLGDLGDLELPAGELAFMRFSDTCSRSHSAPILVYAKKVELDDWPFLLALCSCVDGGAKCAKTEFDKLSMQMDDVVSTLASEFFYLAPMRRQTFV